VKCSVFFVTVSLLLFHFVTVALATCDVFFLSSRTVIIHLLFICKLSVGAIMSTI